MYAYWCLHNLKMRPSEFAFMDKNEKAFIMAAIDIYLEKQSERGR